MLDPYCLQGMLPLEEIKRRVSQFTSTGLPLVVTQVSDRGELWQRALVPCCVALLLRAPCCCASSTGRHLLQPNCRLPWPAPA